VDISHSCEEISKFAEDGTNSCSFTAQPDSLFQSGIAYKRRGIRASLVSAKNVYMEKDRIA
jgi:hypothetical protein